MKIWMIALFQYLCATGLVGSSLYLGIKAFETGQPRGLGIAALALGLGVYIGFNTLYWMRDERICDKR